MPNFNLRRRIARLLFRDEFELLREGIAAAADARHWVRVSQPGGDATRVARFGEVDEQLMDLLLDQAGYVQIGGLSGFQPLERIYDERRRQMSVMDSRNMYHKDVITARAVDMWTDFGFGQHVTVTPNDPALAEAFDEFWNAPRNRAILGDSIIHENSQTALVDGELFWVVWASKLDGECTLRSITTDWIRDIICDPEDPVTPVYYVQASAEGDVYLPDWRADPDMLARVKIPANAINGETLRPLTRVVVIPIQRNRIGKRGWPQARQAFIWARAYRDFIGDRATVAKKAAMYVEKITAKNTNQRGVDDIVGRLQSSLASSGLSGSDRHANTAAGQTWVQNEQVNREWMSRDTGASAAQIDGLTILGQAAAGLGMPLNWLGRPDAMQNQAVAKESNIPVYEQIERYQTFWASVFSDLVEVVGRMQNDYAGAAITDFSAEVGLDSQFQNDLETINAFSGTVNTAGLQPLVKERVSNRLINLGLKALGVRDSEKLLEPPAVNIAPILAGPDTGLPGTVPALADAPTAGPSPLVRAALALEKATEALHNEPPAGQPVTIIAGAEGAAMLPPPVVNTIVDLSAVAEAINRLPGATDLRPLLEAIAAQRPVIENKIDLTQLAEALEGQAVDVPALVAQLVAALQSLPAPVVNVQPVIEQPQTKEKASFKFTYDQSGRVVGATKSGETEPA